MLAESATIPNAEHVWMAVISDPTFAAKYPEGNPLREAIRPFIEGSVIALADMLDTPLTLQVAADAKMRYLRYTLDNGIAKVVADMQGIDKDLVASMLQDLVEMLEPQVKNMSALLEASGVTEEQVMTSPRFGLNPDNLRQWRAGTLTVGKLLVTQPHVILKNED